MTEKCVAFDLEIAKVVPGDFGDWKQHRPLGISCAATMVGGDPEGPTAWTGIGPVPLLEHAAKMDSRQAGLVAVELVLWALRGYQVVTWNGLGFDFDVLCEECDRQTIIARLARTLASGPMHVDMMFAFFCWKGFAISLDAAARGMGLAGKVEGMSGAKAPEMWAQGMTGQKAVLEYVKQDARTTMEVYSTALERGRLSWLTRSAEVRSWELPGGCWPSVEESLRAPEPDVSWLTDPWPRSKFTGWLDQQPLRV